MAWTEDQKQAARDRMAKAREAKVNKIHKVTEPLPEVPIIDKKEEVDVEVQRQEKEIVEDVKCKRCKTNLVVVSHKGVKVCAECLAPTEWEN